MVKPRKKQQISNYFKVGQKFEDVDVGKIVWRYEIEAVSRGYDRVRGNQCAYFLAIYYEELDDMEAVFTQETYTMMSHEELSNSRHITKVDEWTDGLFRYGFDDEEHFKKEDYIKLIHKKYPDIKVTDFSLDLDID